ncbi:MAG: hypothetical protein CMP53_05405 [Flavobacteriales bacterium]|nr:hypothetical protein [Flavobacteriales bacterium]|tara:strand:+ start:785 stop:1147 length:363 start_codon:yes stop_codon:yes gene_type:complete
MLNANPPTEQNTDEDDCPICGLPLKYPALSRFDNKTYVCGQCGQSEGTGFLFSLFDDTQRIMLQDREWANTYGLTEWQAHCIVIAAINGSTLGYQKKSREAFERLREMMDNGTLEKLEEE